jgi:hypothetical protein
MKLIRIILSVLDIDKVAKIYSARFDIAGHRVSPGRHYFNLEGTILVCDEPFADRDEGKED